jgi:histone H2B
MQPLQVLETSGKISLFTFSMADQDEQEGITAQDPGEDVSHPGPASPAAPGRASRYRQRPSFKIYIYKVLKQVHPDLGISERAMRIMDSLCVDLFERLASAAGVIAQRQLEQKSSRTTSDMPIMNAESVSVAAQLLFPGDLAKHAVSDGVKALIKYVASRTEDDPTFDIGEHDDDDDAGSYDPEPGSAAVDQ